jgi:hypothetical protein
VPRESFDAAENLPKETPCQVAFGQLEDVVPGMPDQAAAGLEQPHQTGSISPAGMEVSTSSLIERKGARHRMQVFEYLGESELRSDFAVED